MTGNCRPVKMDQELVEYMGDNYEIGPEKDLFGIEIELEGRKIATKKSHIMEFWALHEDGSLRANKTASEAWEYVLRRPLNMKDTKEAIQTLFAYLTTNEGTEVFDSYRTSIHVHVNCLHETIRTVVNFITLSIIFDELFVSQNGETRIGNNFCLRARDAEGQLENLITAIKESGSFEYIQGNYRYSSTNIVSLNKFGTIEFRSLECTTDYDRLINWISILQHLKERAREFDNPKEIISQFSRRGVFGFMLDMLGEHRARYATVPEAQRMLRDGMRLAQDFAYCSDWKVPEPGQEEPKKRTIRTKPLKWGEAPPGQGFGADLLAQQQAMDVWNAAHQPVHAIAPPIIHAAPVQFEDIEVDLDDDFA